VGCFADKTVLPSAFVNCIDVKYVQRNWLSNTLVCGTHLSTDAEKYLYTSKVRKIIIQGNYAL
jgi:hypothetical protein